MHAMLLFREIKSFMSEYAYFPATVGTSKEYDDPVLSIHNTVGD